MKAIVVYSGGMDSTTLLYKLRKEGVECIALSFDYGQRHSKELEYAQEMCYKLDVPPYRIDLYQLGELFDSSCLTNTEMEVPEGHYAEENMKKTVVPNRNAIMLSIAWGLAVDRQCQIVATAVHAGDHAIYPDCRPQFISQLEEAFRTGTEGFRLPGLSLYTPFIHMTKAQIAAEGARMMVPFEQTWSCYKGGALHCGKCGTCVERREAFQLAGLIDPTEYENA